MHDSLTAQGAGVGPSPNPSAMSGAAGGSSVLAANRYGASHVHAVGARKQRRADRNGHKSLVMSQDFTHGLHHVDPDLDPSQRAGQQRSRPAQLEQYSQKPHNINTIGASSYVLSASNISVPPGGVAIKYDAYKNGGPQAKRQPSRQLTANQQAKPPRAHQRLNNFFLQGGATAGAAGSSVSGLAGANSTQPIKSLVSLASSNGPVGSTEPTNEIAVSNKRNGG